jgi:hypothetical protein
MKFAGTFNFSGEISQLETEAITERQAWSQFCCGLAKKYQRQPRVMLNWFDGRRDNYKIQKEGVLEDII